jgi:hypothetical protein
MCGHVTATYPPLSRGTKLLLQAAENKAPNHPVLRDMQRTPEWKGNWKRRRPLAEHERTALLQDHAVVLEYVGLDLEQRFGYKRMPQSRAVRWLFPVRAQTRRASRRLCRAPRPRARVQRSRSSGRPSRQDEPEPAPPLGGLAAALAVDRAVLRYRGRVTS